MYNMGLEEWNQFVRPLWEGRTGDRARDEYIMFHHSNRMRCSRGQYADPAGSKRLGAMVNVPNADLVSREFEPACIQLRPPEGKTL
jgi:hypothetical protein